MRHVYIRGIMAVIWLAAAIASGVSGNVEMTVLYVALGAAHRRFSDTNIAVRPVPDGGQLHCRRDVAGSFLGGQRRKYAEYVYAPF